MSLPVDVTGIEEMGPRQRLVVSTMLTRHNLAVQNEEFERAQQALIEVFDYCVDGDVSQETLESLSAQQVDELAEEIFGDQLDEE